MKNNSVVNDDKVITAEQYVRVWQKSASKQKAAESLGISKEKLSSMIYLLRSRGVKLKTARILYTPQEIQRLNIIAEKCLNNTDEQI